MYVFVRVLVEESEAHIESLCGCFSMSKTNIHLCREVFERCVGWSNARSNNKRLILVFLKTSGRET
jgi:hypothetical protein